MKDKLRIYILIISLSIYGVVNAQPAHLSHKLQLDPAVRSGVLNNGLTYYIRYNDVPDNKINMYLAQKTGTVLEEDKEIGFSDLIGRMAFCGTKNFPESSMINFFDRKGFEYGDDIDNKISFDYIIYNICNINSLDKYAVDSSMLILYDWANFISLETKGIEREKYKSYLIDSSRYNAEERLFRVAILPEMFPGCRYGKNGAVISPDSLLSADSKDLRNYYYKWYRPDLQALVIVGDVDVDATEKQIKEMWSDVPVQSEPAMRYYVTVADNETPIAAVATDSAMSVNKIEINYKQDVMSSDFKRSYPGYVNTVLNRLISMMISERLYYLSKEPDSKFIKANGNYGSYFTAKTKDALNFEVQFSEGEWEPAMKQILAAINSLKKYGFTSSEYKRAKENFMSYIQLEMLNTDNKSNSDYADVYLDYFINDNPAPAIDVKYKICRKLTEVIPLEQLNALIRDYIKENNIAMYMIGRANEFLQSPKSADLIQVYKTEMSKPATAYTDKYNEYLFDNAYGDITEMDVK